MATPPQGAFTPGMLFHGRYQIVRCLASGGMGSVYECVHLTTQKHRALKIMLPQMLARSDMRERFELEARVTAQIDSEHIVETFDAGIDPTTEAPFLVMELLRGEDLDTMVRTRGPLRAEDLVPLLAQAALALDKTHAAGIVHRDLKPQNLFLTTRDDGSPRLKILDFGVAKIVADQSRTATVTAAIGTPVYMAPEQTTGDGGIGPQADLFALGHIAYALLTGEAYWTEEARSLPVFGFMSAMILGAKEPPTARALRRGVTLPAAFDAWFMHATARRPQDRFDHASTQIADLAVVLGVAVPRAPTSPSADLSPALHALSPAIAPSVPSVSSAPNPSSISGVSGVAAVQSSPSVPSPMGSSSSPSSPSSPALAPIATGGTMDAIANEPAEPASSRVSLAVLVAVVAIASTVGTVALVRSLHLGEGAGVSAHAVDDGGQPAGARTAATTAPEPAPTVTPAASAPASPTAAPEASASAAPSSAPSVRKPAPSTGPSKTAPNCNPPFTVDASGARHAKPECL